jgi:hypothetical protein
LFELEGKASTRAVTAYRSALGAPAGISRGEIAEFELDLPALVVVGPSHQDEAGRASLKTRSCGSVTDSWPWFAR